MSLKLELLAPVYEQVPRRFGARVELPVELTPGDGDGVTLVFSTLPLTVTKELVCVKGPDCGCQFLCLLRQMIDLVEHGILDVKAKYVVSCTTTKNDPPIATIELQLGLSPDCPDTSKPLTGLEFVLCHFQPTLVSVVPWNEKRRSKSVEKSLKDAQDSTCHVVGCRLHALRGEAAAMAKTKQLFLSDVFRSLISPLDVGQMNIREDGTYVERMSHPKRQLIVTDLPVQVLKQVVRFMDARELARVCMVCSLFQHLAYEVVPDLKLVLYLHQRRALKWMLHREASARMESLPRHPFVFPATKNERAKVSIDLVDERIVSNPTPKTHDARGGLFCDEPGLGKTITMLALILRTKTQRSTPHALVDLSERGEGVSLRSAKSRGRHVRTDKLLSSHASLIIVPDPLVKHWKFQLETYVNEGALKVFIDRGLELPSAAELAKFDVVVTSFTRLDNDWKYYRPPSTLEERMPKRYGFEDGPQRYADGEIRKGISSLLLVHWVRLIVDEGHKLGGTTPTNQMQMARIFSADKRWVMTGTPTPNTLRSHDLRHLHGLLTFLHDRPYGHPDGKAWVKAIAAPFERNEIIAFYRLQHLLSRIMMRHTKDSVSHLIPKPIRQNVLIAPTPTEYEQYNSIANVVRMNLAITNMDPHTPGMDHPDSLLNPINRAHAVLVMGNIRRACCGGNELDVVMTDKVLTETVDYATKELGISPEKMIPIREFLRRVPFRGLRTECSSCKRHLQLVLILPCGDLCCADCVDEQFHRNGPVCLTCGVTYDPEKLQELQPGLEYTVIEEKVIKSSSRGAGINNHGNLAQNGQQNRRNQRNQNPRPFRALDELLHLDFVDSSKAFYIVKRVGELKAEYASAEATRMTPYGVSRTAPRAVKALVFSQFRHNIWAVRVAFRQQKVPIANFITGVSKTERMEDLARFRSDPSTNVLLLSDIGSHGLDLSFVTHIFLVDEIWDESLENQVISRAHRMGAYQSVIVEQLTMKGTIEELMHREKRRQARVLQRAVASPSNEPRSSSPKQHRGKTLLETQFGTPRKNTTKKSPSKMKASDANEGKASRLHGKLSHLLSNLRLLDETQVAEPGQVVFTVLDDKDAIVRRGSHTMTMNKANAQEIQRVHAKIAAQALARLNAKGCSNVTASLNGAENANTSASINSNAAQSDTVDLTTSDNDEERKKRALKRESEAHEPPRAAGKKKRRMIRFAIPDDDDSTETDNYDDE